MPDLTTLAVVTYLVGVVLGLARVDARPVGRVALALCWPVGPAAFVVTVAGLLVVTAIAFPVFGVVLVVLAGVLYRLLASL